MNTTIVAGSPLRVARHSAEFSAASMVIAGLTATIS
jgi:hypothetical protein